MENVLPEACSFKGSKISDSSNALFRPMLKIPRVHLQNFQSKTQSRKMKNRTQNFKGNLFPKTKQDILISRIQRCRWYEINWKIFQHYLLLF